MTQSTVPFTFFIMTQPIIFGECRAITYQASAISYCCKPYKNTDTSPL